MASMTSIGVNGKPLPPAKASAPTRGGENESISVFDIFKIGVGPSSSHTMGPWRAAQKFTAELTSRGVFDQVVRVRTDLYGSLAKTGHGHGTDVAVVLGLSGEDVVTCQVEGLRERAEKPAKVGRLSLGGKREIAFDGDADLVFHMQESLPFHPNAVRFTALLESGESVTGTYYSVGGGFVVQENQSLSAARAVKLPYPIETGEDLKGHTATLKTTIPGVVMANERTWRSEAEVRSGLLSIWRVMQECVYRGVHTEGVLPGGLELSRRAAGLHSQLISGAQYNDLDGWLKAARFRTADFRDITNWVSAFALAVNEENAAFGRVVTAPTNGAAGVIPAVMMYYWCFCEESARAGEDGIVDFMLTAGEIGSLFKKGATISAAMGGCQAEIGVSSAMAAAGLAQVLGASTGQALQAAEIAMEHHLGMTCDPVGGLVQIPCIERNTMGAIKAITAANIALGSDPSKAKVSLDGVIKTMWDTAQDMQSKYKETSEGGLAVNVTISEC